MAAKEKARKPAIKATKATKAAKRKPAAVKAARKKAKVKASAKAFSATSTAVKQIGEAYKAMKRMGVSLERSAHLSRRAGVAEGASQGFVQKMEKLQQRLQAATEQYKKLYEATLAKMTGHTEKPAASDDSKSSPTE